MSMSMTTGMNDMSMSMPTSTSMSMDMGTMSSMAPMASSSGGMSGMDDMEGMGMGNGCKISVRKPLSHTHLSQTLTRKLT